MANEKSLQLKKIDPIKAAKKLTASAKKLEGELKGCEKAKRVSSRLLRSRITI